MAGLRKSKAKEVFKHICQVAAVFTEDFVMAGIVDEIRNSIPAAIFSGEDVFMGHTVEEIGTYDPGAVIPRAFVARVHARIASAMGRGCDNSNALVESLRLVDTPYFQCLVEFIEQQMQKWSLEHTLYMNCKF